MKCGRVEWLAAEWAAGTLSPSEAGSIERHRAQCAACSQMLAAEARFRQVWSEKSGLEKAPVELWPRLCVRLAPRRRRASLVPRLVWSGAALVVAAALGLHPWPPSSERPAPAVIAAVKNSAAAPPGAPMEALASWSGMNDAATPNPAVDDPAGTAMEEIWTHIKSENK